MNDMSELITQMILFIFFVLWCWDCLKKKRFHAVLKWGFSLALMYVYCMIWQLLELYIDGRITNRPVDNIMMVLLMPLFYIAVDWTLMKVLRKNKEEKEGE